MATISYNDFTTPTGDWDIAPTQPYEYKNPLGNQVTLSNGDTYITFSDLPVGMTVGGPPATTEPFDSIYFNNALVASDILIKTGDASLGTIWANESYVLYGDVYVSSIAAYTSGGYWAYGAPDTALYFQGVYFTGAGNANTLPTDVAWLPIESIDDGLLVPFPFNTTCVYGVYTNFEPPVPNEIYSNYQVINSNTIKVLNLDSLITSGKKLYIIFNAS